MDRANKRNPGTCSLDSGLGISLANGLLDCAMTDQLDAARRSRNMARIRAKDTGPELRVRRVAHAMGLRFRLHRSGLPGNPDLVFPRRRLAMFVHGCFWHGHGCQRGGKGPKSNIQYWGPKIERTRARDASAMQALERLGWRVAVLWECELRDEAFVRGAIRNAIGV